MMADIEANGSDSSKELYRIHNEKVLELLPLIIIMTVLGIVGVLGNIVTILFYSKKHRQTQTIFLIKALAAVDLIVCVLFVPNIVEMTVNVLYTSAVACKIMHFLGHWFLESSGLILGFIAFDRYWKICGSYKTVMSRNTPKTVVVCIIVFSCLMSIRDIVNFDVVEAKLNKDNATVDVIGHLCSNSHNPDLKWSILIFHGIDALTFLMILVIIVMAYSKVLWTLSKLKKQFQQRESAFSSCKSRRRSVFVRNKKGKISDNRIDNVNDSTEDIQITTRNTDENEKEKTPTLLTVPSNTPRYKSSLTSLNSNTPKKEKSVKWNKETMIKCKKIRKSERNVTMLMCAVSFAFFLTASPYFAVRIGLKVLKKDEDGFELGLLYQFGLRLGYINSVLNPLIYTLFNPSFRRHLRRILTCTKGALSALVTQTSMTSERPSLSKGSKFSESFDKGIEGNDTDDSKVVKVS